MANNITEKAENVVITDNFILGNLIRENLDTPLIAFQNITNSYVILREIEKTNIKNITFIVRLQQAEENLDFIIERILKDLLPLNYNIDIKYIDKYRDIFDEKFNVSYTLNKVAQN